MGGLICQETLGSIPFHWVMTHIKFHTRLRGVTAAVSLFVNRGTAMLSRLSHWPTTGVIQDQLDSGGGSVDHYTGTSADNLSRGQMLNEGGTHCDQYNCMFVEFDLWGPIWRESSCVQSRMSCGSKYTGGPVVSLSGLCLPLYEATVYCDPKRLPQGKEIIT